MEIIYKNDDIINKKYVIYLITLRTGSHRYKVHYIGKTKRELHKRMEEHIKNKHCPVGQCIYENELDKIYVEVLYECSEDDRINLDMFETRELCRYYSKRGTIKNERNRLINRDLKGLDTYTLKAIKEKFAEMSILLGAD